MAKWLACHMLCHSLEERKHAKCLKIKTLAHKITNDTSCISIPKLGGQRRSRRPPLFVIDILCCISESVIFCVAVFVEGVCVICCFETANKYVGSAILQYVNGGIGDDGNTFQQSSFCKFAKPGGVFQSRDVIDGPSVFLLWLRSFVNAPGGFDSCGRILLECPNHVVLPGYAWLG